MTEHINIHSNRLTANTKSQVNFFILLIFVHLKGHNHLLTYSKLKRVLGTIKTNGNADFRWSQYGGSTATIKDKNNCTKKCNSRCECAASYTRMIMPKGRVLYWVLIRSAGGELWVTNSIAARSRHFARVCLANLMIQVPGHVHCNAWHFHMFGQLFLMNRSNIVFLPSSIFHIKDSSGELKK